MFRRVASVLMVAGLAAAASASEKAHWGYEGDTGPDKWANLSPDNAACAGTQQSPIDIVPGQAVGAEVAPIDLAWQSFVPEVVDNGHTIQVNTQGKGGHLTLGAKRYDLVQFHFHHRSEHTIGGEFRPLEVHFVHAASDGDLVVIGGFFVPGGVNNTLAAIWSAIPAKGATGTAEAINPIKLLAAGGRIFRYKGSLTTPPCSEIVTWHLLAEPVTASKAQIDAFAKLYPVNNRPVQPVNRRFVLTGN